LQIICDKQPPLGAFIIWTVRGERKGGLSTHTGILFSDRKTFQTSRERRGLPNVRKKKRSSLCFDATTTVYSYISNDLNSVPKIGSSSLYRREMVRRHHITPTADFSKIELDDDGHLPTTKFCREYSGRQMLTRILHKTSISLSAAAA
jgi:hypothetical protein